MRTIFIFVQRLTPRPPISMLASFLFFLCLCLGAFCSTLKLGAWGYFLHPRTCETVAIFLLPSVEDCLFLVFILGGRLVYVSFEQAFLNPFYFIVWVVPIFCFCSESVPHVYVHRASDLRGLLQPTASPRVEAVQDSIQGHHLLLCPFVTQIAWLCRTVPLDVDLEPYSKALSSAPGCGSRAVQQSFQECGASGFSGGVNAELM